MSINDAVFGIMNYDIAFWEKSEKVNIWGKDFEIEINVRAYDKAEISDIQRNSYLYFKSNLRVISDYTASLICNYVEENFTDLSLYWNNPKHYKSAEDFGDDFELISVIFEEDGSILLLCNAACDIENGIGIKLNRFYGIGIQSLFL